MSSIDNTSQNYFTRMPIDFILRHEKQHLVIDFLKNHMSLNTTHLAKLLNISAKKLTDVQMKKTYLQAIEAEKLIRCFCIFCGN